MEPGNIVEYIDQQKIICAVILEAKNKRLRLLTESNREVKVSSSRLSHLTRNALSAESSRDSLINALKETVHRRRELVDQVDVKELWEVLNGEQEWIDLVTMTELCFSDSPTADHESAVIRAFFKDKIYFKFNADKFFPNTEEQVEQIITRKKEADRKKALIEQGGEWLKKVMTGGTPEAGPETADFIEILKSYYIFEDESRHAGTAKQILEKAGIDAGDKLFFLLVRLGVFEENENIDLKRFEVPVSFSQGASDMAESLVSSADPFDTTNRKDLTHLDLMTIDGQSTKDFDDAISLEKDGDHYLLGIHIVDVAHFVKPGDDLDKTALNRGSSIYTPDQKIPMLPSVLSENLCSLIGGEIRPAITTMIRLSRFFDVIGHEIFASTINVKRQLTYSETNRLVDEEEEFSILNKIGQTFRDKRLASGAVQITLPEVNVWLDENNEIIISRIDRESSSRMFVAEMMIMANALTARFLKENSMPAIFRSQPDPKARLYKGNEGSFFQNCMQRKQLSRVVIGYEPEHHAGLGLDAYVTATSPIRKYYDLITQRQVKAVLGMETPYSEEDIHNFYQLLEQPMSTVGRIQFSRRRYWILKYLESKTGSREEALVLEERRNSYIIILKEYMLECRLPHSSGINLKPESLIQVVIQHVNARKDILSVFMG